MFTETENTQFPFVSLSLSLYCVHVLRSWLVHLLGRCAPVGFPEKLLAQVSLSEILISSHTKYKQFVLTLKVIILTALNF